MHTCKICNTSTYTILSFGKMPIANGFLKNKSEKEFFYNLTYVFCPLCFMVQLDETVPAQMMFNDSYHFISSTSKVMENHFEKNADHILHLIANKKDPFVVELGSNDGIMLKHIAKKGIRHLGIEPSKNVAEMSEKDNVNVLSDFFNISTAKKIYKQYGKADVICGSNVFCHIENIKSVFEGMKELLDSDGIIFFEDPYLYDIITQNSFDQIYDEHVYYYSGISVLSLAQKYHFQLVDMVHQDVHGGSMRYYLKKGLNNKKNTQVRKYISKEKELHLDTFEGYKMFEENVNTISRELKRVLLKIKKEGKSIIGYGATSKSTTLLNYANINSDLLNCITDTTPTKINKFSPGMHIPIVSYDYFQNNPPDYTLLLAWNHKNEIFEKEKLYRKNGGKFITFFPKVNIE